MICLHVFNNKYYGVPIFYWNEISKHTDKNELFISIYFEKF